jgi:hypothetical protein
VILGCAKQLWFAVHRTTCDCKLLLAPAPCHAFDNVLTIARVECSFFVMYMGWWMVLHWTAPWAHPLYAHTHVGR